jgi:Icc protein
MTSHVYRIAQFSDLHLSSQVGGLCKGVDCWQQLRKMLAHLSEESPVDGLVLTGDIAHDESRDTYERLHDILKQLSIPYFLIPGNHDDPKLMQEVFSEQVSADGTAMCFDWVLRDLAVIGLDTHEPGSDGGSLSAANLRWFQKQCELNAERSVLVFMHHPPLNTGDVFFDSIGLAERDSFWETIKSYPQVKAIGFGHLHRPLELNETPWVQGAPSTAFAMKKTMNGWDIRTEDAGYLIWSLSQDEVKTEVLVQG